MTTFHEVAVVGGGPAGAFAAWHLARAGVGVALIDPQSTDIAAGQPEHRAQTRLEGLGDRVAHLLAAKGLARALEAATDPVRRSVRWAGLAQSANRERLVDRHLFDALLRHEAVAAGAVFHRDRLAGASVLARREGVRLSLAGGITLHARLMIDARGRQARAGRRLMGPQTLSIAGFVTGGRAASAPGDAAGSDEAAAHVEATPQGWVWDVTHPRLGRWVQISIDAGDLRGAGQAGLAARFRRFLSQEQFEGRCEAGQYEGCVIDGPLRARNCGLVLSAGSLTPPVIPIGDAAVAIDPLSGHGQFWALSSALSALPIVAQLLDDRQDESGLVRRFFEDRVVGTFWRQARVGRDFYRLERDLAVHPYWAARVGWPDAAPSHPPVAASRLERRVVVEAGRLCEREVLVTPMDPDGVAFIAGIAVGDLVRAGSAGEGVTLRPEAARAPHPAIGWLESRGLSPASNEITTSTRSTTTRETA
ncbi:flavin-dependent dehydrogenase [Breoghania corrubedonensis]|uniref:Flavin-dependent dehydrogenase n=1 Tax=Breoghania corrubedonensis TaxID=665038 RepID=A0A2T5V6G4_9HYPH|nr:tryptophan 7-halogenase [Breoghania corrubedonensis]PTW59340.1 flavin-dependent dehydrogenase [Breoghania corrubedonensis]